MGKSVPDSRGYLRKTAHCVYPGSTVELALGMAFVFVLFVFFVV